LTTKIKTLIVEDDASASKYLSTMLQNNFSQIDIIGSAESVKDSIKLIDTLKPEIIFMDIVLSDGNAFQIFDKIKYNDFEVIFVTSHEEYLKKAIEEHYAFYYTSKPVAISKIEGVVCKYDNLKKRMTALNNYQMFSDFLKGNTTKLLIQVSNQYLALNIKDIVKCLADGNYTYFYMSDKKRYLASKSLKYYENLLINKGFFKAHRSTIINIGYIKSIYKKEAIILYNDEKIIISRRNKINLNRLIGQLS